MPVVTGTAVSFHQINILSFKPMPSSGFTQKKTSENNKLKISDACRQNDGVRKETNRVVPSSQDFKENFVLVRLNI
jgi:hypothetical protein